jgi:hypothetical protein
VRASWPGVALLLAGCAAAGGWSKPGANAANAAREYEDCRTLADSAVQTDAEIDQDILATRLGDRQRASGVRAETQTMQEHTGGRANAIVAACMRAKGFAEPR